MELDHAEHAFGNQRGGDSMKLVFRGRSQGCGAQIVGVATRETLPYGARATRVLVADRLNGEDLRGYGAVITLAAEAGKPSQGTELPFVFEVPEFADIQSGHIIAADPQSGTIRVLYRPESIHNFLFVTEMCNSNCVMCSQPPKERDDRDELAERNLAVLGLLESGPQHLTITGGEPTLLGERLARLLTVLRDKFPDTRVHVLTNGRQFADISFAAQLAGRLHPNLSWGIPLYSDLPWEHDFVVQSRSAFSETLRGLLNLARWRQRIEIRVVLHAHTVSRLPQLAAFIRRNLTFVEHVALMGLEHVGFAVGNMRGLWIDPADYQHELEAAVETLTVAGMPVSIYNHQLCTLPRNLWPFARRSISDWKNTFRSECDACSVRPECGGFFQWNIEKVSRHFGPVAS